VLASLVWHLSVTLTLSFVPRIKKHAVFTVDKHGDPYYKGKNKGQSSGWVLCIPLRYRTKTLLGLFTGVLKCLQIPYKSSKEEDWQWKNKLGKTYVALILSDYYRWLTSIVTPPRVWCTSMRYEPTGCSN